ncbi:hypothetical protein [Enterococcus faecalis]|uniref:hypothetical protein n=1 Tax=Enterococcus faecalis TaxID=1351 RepID=UPI0021E093C4|nr:hypothetical protein [Enterococcus faecalis]MCU9772820.1 hypothetical protein [Enterococcus faecalis]MCU9792144.1 hypothetical protein [Enterococcus faecalis]HEC4826998.1 hypothetical protein [Enterococcus faecalis]
MTIAAAFSKASGKYFDRSTRAVDSSKLSYNTTKALERITLIHLQARETLLSLL